MIGLLFAVAVASTVCVPQIEGDPAAVDAVRRELRRETSPDCPPTKARIEANGEGWIVTLRGASLLVHDPRTAAAWIESRTRSDLAAPLMDLAVLEDRPAERPEVVASPSKPALPLEIAARAELGWTDVGAETGAAATISFGRWIVEPAVILRGAGGRFDPSGLAPARRWDAEALAGLRLPVTLGRFAVRPGLAAGVGLDGISRDRCADCLPMVDDDASRVEAGLRTEAFVDASVPIAGGFAFALSVSASASPFADGSPSLPPWLPPERQGAAHLALPGAPVSRIRAGAGLSWSVP